MRRLSLLGMVLGFSSIAACSLINAPDEVKPGGNGGGGNDPTSSSTVVSSSSSVVSSSSSSGGTQCTSDDFMTTCVALIPGPCRVIKACNNGFCEFDQAPNNTACDDGLFCTDGDICVAGTCTAGPARDCPASNDCRMGTCNEDTDSCEESFLPDDAPCDDNDPCTLTSACGAGTCVPGPGCKDSECTVGVCTPQGCMDQPKPVDTPCGITDCSNGACNDEGKCVIQPINVGNPCDDGLFCTSNTTCTNTGKCSGGNPTCPDVNTCVLGTCDEATDTCGVMTAPVGTACDDGIPCTVNDVCNGAICAGTTAPSGTACDDGNVCTYGETCNAQNQCSGGVPSAVVFVDTFTGGNLKGWTLGPEWQIAPAQAGMLGQSCCGFTPDPNIDHTPTADNFIAGVVIGNGGLATTNLHPFSYLTSPNINTSNVQAQVYLTFWRFLNTDYPPFMHNVVEVSSDGGMNWTKIWSHDEQVPIADGGWQFQSYDITAFKSANTRFRIGFDVGDTGVYSVGGWNVDDVRVQTAPCPM